MWSLLDTRFHNAQRAQNINIPTCEGVPSLQKWRAEAGAHTLTQTSASAKLRWASQVHHVDVPRRKRPSPYPRIPLPPDALC